MQPQKPIRKAAKTSNDNLARPMSSPISKTAYNRKSAAPFGSVPKTAYTRKAAGVNAGNHAINRTSGDAAQPHNNKKSS